MDRMKTLALATTLLLALGAAFGQTTGEEVYLQNCSACHQANGQGIPSAFPPLAGHVPVLLATEEGKEYLIRVMLYGLQGEIVVDEQAYNGVMPGWAQLGDEQIAEVLNYISTAWENSARLPEEFEPFTAEAVAAARDLGLTPAEVLELRTPLLEAEE